MKKVIKIDANGLFVEDVLIEEEAETPEGCIDVECPDGFYKPKWDGLAWIEGLSQTEIDGIRASLPENIKAEAVAEIESATTIEDLRTAMLKFVNASS